MKPKEKKEKKVERTIDIKKLRNRKKYENIDDIFGGIDIRKDNLKSAEKEIKYQEIEYKPKVKKENRAPIEVKSHSKERNLNEPIESSSKSRASDKIFKISKQKNLLNEKITSKLPPQNPNARKLTNTIKKPISPIKKGIAVQPKSSQPKLNAIKKDNKIRKVKDESSEEEDKSTTNSEEYSDDYPEDDSGSDVEDKEEYYKKNYRDFIRKAFGYDRNDPKYLIRDRMRLEDVDFDEREKEERRSYLLGLKEDREERLKEEMRKKKRKKK